MVDPNRDALDVQSRGILVHLKGMTDPRIITAVSLQDVSSDLWHRTSRHVDDATRLCVQRAHFSAVSREAGWRNTPSESQRDVHERTILKFAPSMRLRRFQTENPGLTYLLFVAE